VYRCRCSRREIADSGTHGIDGIVYPGTCRDLALGMEVPGADRFRVDDAPVDFDDRLQGPQSQRLARDIGDFVVKRRDGLFAYQLAVVVDDADLGVTDVVRGADLLDSTPRQIALQRALGFTTPRYLHIPVATRNGEKLSKQTLAPALDAHEGSRLIAKALKFLGQDVPDIGERPRRLLAAAASRYSPSHIPRARTVEIAD
jgi:glutamyl-Q tRNA(Asp) synthetase